ncbi:MAG: glycosyltransferase, partial [Candidatus Gracilibacteria bacterium]
WISWLAFIVVVLSGASGVFYIINYFLSPGSPQGFSTLIVGILFLGGIQLLCLSIIGQYLGRIFEEIKQRPIYVIDEILNAHSNSNS